jgi:hypothetical protein
MAKIKVSELKEMLTSKGVSEGFIGNLIARVTGKAKNSPEYKELEKKAAQLEKDYDTFVKKHDLKPVKW